MHRTQIAGVGYYLPEEVITNADLEKLVDTNDQWIVERTGIRKRHRVSTGKATSDSCYHAAIQALKKANLKATDLDLILVATVTPDFILPSTACVLQNLLGCKTIPAFDLVAACSGFIYGLTVADQFIRTGMYKNILVIGAESLSRMVSYKDRETCILFGDGAGAWVVSQAPEGSKNIILSSHIHAEGSLVDLLWVPEGGSKVPFSQSVLDKGSHYMTMKGRDIFKNAVRTMNAACQEALQANQVTASEVDWMVPHQANLRILESVANHFDFPMDKVAISVAETGNTSAASIPICFGMYEEAGKIQRGQMILLTAFGAGLTSGSLLMRY